MERGGGAVHITGAPGILHGDGPRQRDSLVLAQIQSGMLPQGGQHPLKIGAGPGLKMIPCAGLLHQAAEIVQPLAAIRPAGHALAHGQTNVIAPFGVERGKNLLLRAARKGQHILTAALNQLLIAAVRRKGKARPPKLFNGGRIVLRNHGVHFKQKRTVPPAQFPDGTSQSPQYLFVLQIVSYRAAGRVQKRKGKKRNFPDQHLHGRADGARFVPQQNPLAAPLAFHLRPPAALHKRALRMVGYKRFITSGLLFFPGSGSHGFTDCAVHMFFLPFSYTVLSV